MTGELLKALGLPEINRPEGTNGNGEFSQDFRAGLTKVNQDMQVVAVHGAPGEHQTLDSHRQTLIKAYQTANSIGDPTKNDQVLGAVAKVGQQTSDKAAKINAGYDEWQKRQPAFDAAVVKIGELEDAGHPNAPAFRKVSEAIQARAKGKDYQNANAAFDQLQPKLDDLITQPNGPTSGLDGLDSGQVQALNAGQVIGPATKVATKLWNWITEQGVTTIVIENYTSKVLRFESEQRIHPKESNWVDHPPTEIMAAKSPHDPTKVTMSLKTDKWVRGVSRADTSGFVVYNINDTHKERTFVKEAKEGKVTKKVTKMVAAFVRAAWSRKGQGEFDSKGTTTDLGGYKFEVQQVNGGTITYRFTEEAPNPKPKDPQTPDDKKPKEPSTPTDTKLKPFDYPIGPFVTGKHDKLETGSITKHAHDILNDKDKLDGKVPAGLKIEVHGYTSNTDTADRNFVLSKQRAEAVIKALKEVGIPATAIADPRPHGEWETKPSTDDKKQEIEDADWRKVVVKVSQ